MGGLLRPVAPLMLKTRGAVHQPVNSLPSGWPSIFPPLWYKPFEQPCPQPLTHCPLLTLLCPCPSLAYSSPCLRSCFPTLALAESSDPPQFNHHPPPLLHHVIVPWNALVSMELFMFQSFAIAWLPFKWLECWWKDGEIAASSTPPPTMVPLHLLDPWYNITSKLRSGPGFAHMHICVYINLCTMWLGQSQWFWQECSFAVFAGQICANSISVCVVWLMSHGPTLDIRRVFSTEVWCGKKHTNGLIYWLINSLLLLNIFL